jgi:hypothetical protein
MNVAIVYVAVSSIFSASPSHGPGLPNGYIPVTSVEVDVKNASGSTIDVYADLSCQYDTPGAVMVTSKEILTAVVGNSRKVLAVPAVPAMQFGGYYRGKWHITGLTPGTTYELTLQGTAYWDDIPKPWNLYWKWVQPMAAGG